MHDRRQFIAQLSAAAAVHALARGEIREIVSRETHYARIVVCLTGYCWPREMGEAPDWFLEKIALCGAARYIRHVDRWNSLIAGLKTLTTHKEIFRVIECEKKGATPGEFKIWWESYGRRYAEVAEDIDRQPLSLEYRLLAEIATERPVDE